jgi:hypothetical protein
MAIDVRRRDRNPISHANPVTIVITIDPNSSFDWTNVREEVVSLLDQCKLLDVAVNIEKDRV